MRAFNIHELHACRAALHRRRKQRKRVLCCALLSLAALSGVAQDARPKVTTDQGTTAATANAQAVASSDEARAMQAPSTPQDQRKKQIADESTQLLSMAIALKAEVDKTNKDMLSINVIRRADEIEKLARTVKEKIKQSAGPG